MNIVLIDPRANRMPAESFPHLGLGYLAAVCKESGHNVRLIDFRMLSESEREQLVRESHEVVGITATSFTYDDTLKVAAKIRESNPGVKLILGGPHVSVAADDVLIGSPFDFAIEGEGEVTLKELLKELQNGSNDGYRSIPGLMYLENGKTVHNAPRPWIEDLDSLPEPDFSSLDMKQYSHYPLATSRGCPFLCVYCNCGTIWGKKWRFRSPERIVSEMEKLKQHTEWGEKSINIIDDTFNLNSERVEAICDLMISKNMGIDFYVWGFRADRTPLNILQKLKQAGCLCVSVGVESANPGVLKRIRKGETIEQITETLVNLKKVGIYPMCLFMVGNPGDTLETVRETIRFVKKNRLYLVAFNMALPYPKTDLWDYVEREGTFHQKDYTNFHHYSEKPIFETPDFTSAERSEAFRLVQRLERIQRIKFEIWRKFMLIRRGDFSAITWKRVRAFVARLGKYVMDLTLRREPEEKL
ncbi:radical SAM protein [bacterium]|nr:radical SAM protein [bacterium]